MRTAGPAAEPTGTRQAQTGSPSSSTVQAPQSPASQPTLVPVSRRWSRSTAESRVTGWTDTETGAPLTSKVIACPARHAATMARPGGRLPRPCTARRTISRAASRR